MKVSKVFITLAAVACCLLLARDARAQSYIYGSTSISYDPTTNVITGYATTELDYAAQDWYKARVNGSLRDPDNGTVFSSVAASDNDLDGIVSVAVQTSASSGVQYRMNGTHFAQPYIQDYNMGSGWYIDYWSFQPIYNGEDYRYIYMPYFARGPRRNTRTSILNLGRTYANFDLDLPPRAAATAASFDPKEVAKTGGETTLKVEVSTTRATLEGSKITVEIQVESNVNGVVLDIPSFEREVTVGAGQSGQVIPASFTVRTSPNNQASGAVTFRATITSAVNGAGQPIQIGPTPPHATSTIVSSGLTVKP